MTTNHHTPISIGTPANASTFNSPLGQLDSAITDLETDVTDAVSDVSTLTTSMNNLIAGATGFTQLNLSTSTTLTISSGAITISRSRHLVDAEASATYDDLDTINGGVAGDVLVLQSVTASRVVVVKHGTGNIFLNGYDVYLDNPRKALTLLHDGTQWVLMGEPPRRVDRRQLQITFFEGSSHLVGVGAIVSNGTPTNVLDPESSYTQYASAATTSSLAGVSSSVDTMLNPRHDPLLIAWLKTGSSVAGIRWYLGFKTPSIYSAGDNLPSTGVSFIGLRYSTVAGDTGFRPVTSNGTTQTLGSIMNTLTPNTVYKVAVWVVNNVAYFSINDSTPVLATATMPSVSTSMGWVTSLQTTENVAKSVLMRRILFEVN